ncbi:TIGR02996 domain-containing protein [Myxococcus sp. CA039A]|uniref:TIGR02996 domain-containing protein n=1 Tax=Myxococcus sp. CA039A TaxID=2741737 RepID=UPI00157A6AAB|nr:TIGR02996 domain-containing protein [Myxococcus sp. CA039A]NTX56478.1 TIGR02996 domain-containing protein [Myxococcus sp. CA039A]
MSDLDALLAKVVADPTNDAPRLACADALQTVDAARAEFIRVQLALPGRMDPARRRSLQSRVRELMDANGRAWLKPLRDAKVHEPRYHRGFIEELSLAEDRLAKHGPELFALEPVSRLCVDTRDGKGLEHAAEQPWFSQVRWLRLEGSGVDAATKALAASPRAGNLSGLVLAGAKDTAVRALVESKALPALRSVSFSSGALTDTSAEVLAKATLVWERLYLSGSGLSDEGVATLAGAKGLGALQWLTLNRNELSDEAAEALAKSKGLTGLERLELSQNDLSEEGALAFRTAKALPKLRRLELMEMGLDRDELGPLVKRLGAGLRL